MKIKESEKIDKKLDLAKEPEKLWNMKVTETPNVVGVLETVHKGLKKKRRLDELDIRGRIETIQTTALLRSASILRGVLDTKDMLSFRVQWKTIS